MTLSNDFPFELSEEIVSYIKDKEIKKVGLVVRKELKRGEKMLFDLREYEKLQNKLAELLGEESTNFILEIPQIKTSFEKFTYGLEANSYEFDFKNVFSRYQE